MSPTVTRRTQAERTETTRRRLLEATIDTIVERGYQATTTTEISSRAGVSRGAQLHHFPTKAQLVIAAWEHLAETLPEDFRKALAKTARSADRVGRAIDILWGMFSGPAFVAWIELAVGGRGDPELRPHIARLDRRFRQSFADEFLALFPPPVGSDYDAIPTFLLSLFDGLALDQMTDPDPKRVDQVLETLKAIAANTGFGGVTP